MSVRKDLDESLHYSNSGPSMRRRGGPTATWRSRIAWTLAATLSTAGLVGFASAGPAAADTPSLTVNPTCNAYSGALVCSQLFTTSGSVSTRNLQLAEDTAISVIAVGGNGGNAGDTTAGGSGAVALSTATPSNFFSGLTIQLGGNGGNGVMRSGGAGGAGGGPGGSGAGGQGGYGSLGDNITVPDGGGGGGGGGATAVYMAAGFAAAPVTAQNEIALAGGGGGAADLQGYGGWINQSVANGNGAGAINNDGQVCQGGPAGYAAGPGIGSCGGATGTGQTGSTSSGAGGAGVDGNSVALGYGSTLPGKGTIDGGGGGGGGLTGGAGGGTTFADDMAIVNNSAGGGAGGSLNPAQSKPIDGSGPRVELIWTPAATTATTLTLASTTLANSQSVTATAVTYPAFPGIPVSGSVQFFVDNVAYGQPLNTTGSVTQTLSGLTVGAHTVTTSFSSTGPVALDSSTSQPQTITVSKTTPTAWLWSNAATVTWPSKPTLTATLPADATGTVQFSDSATGNLGSAPVVNGLASLTPSALDAGANTITASYSGDNNYTAATSSAITITVTKWVTSAPTALTATPGNGKVGLSWAAPVSTGGSPVNEYKATAVNAVTGATVGTCATVPMGNSPAATGCTITGLTNGTIYYFTVDADNGAGISPNSNQAKATPTKS